MAKVSLRAYNREIETMIDRGQLDEAIAHCRHILKTYPKHLETYRLLGKAYLEYKRHGDAADIFSRILVSVPNDFVAQVGMSIIRDEENRLDDAIWHMERAFETQPSNPAIQAELQRLYARRDGVRPPRIRMTRGALANMYVQGELYPQAISEIKSVLKDDPGRADMQALLARACYQSGLKNEAADVASALLRRYPYSLDANRVLVEILGSEHPENAQLYRQRVFEMDPYAAHVTGSVFLSGEVSDAAVNIERLDWNGQPVVMQPDWSESKAISLESEIAEGEPPDWFKEESPRLDETLPPPSQPTPAPIFDSASPFEQPPAQPADDIPDFMRAAGWGKSTGEFDESKSAFAEGEAEPASGIEQGDLPDWVKAMKPVEAEPPAQAEEEELPDWIANIGAGALASKADDLPEWLNQPTQPSETPASESSEQPAWLSQPEGETESTPAGELGGDLDWLKNLGDTEPTRAAQAEDLDWMKNLGDTEPASETAQADDLDWIKNLGETQPVSSTESAEDLDWMKDLGSAPAEPATASSDDFDWLQNLSSTGSTPPAVQTEEPDWLKGVAEPEPATDEQPDWLKGITGEPEPESSPQEEQSAWMNQSGEEAEEAPATPSGFDFLNQLSEEPILQTPSETTSSAADPDKLGTSEQERDDSFAWLESLAAKQGATEGLLTKPEERLEEEPEWVKQAKGLKSETPVEQPPAEPQPAASLEDLGKSDQEQDDSFAWLENLAARQGATEGLLTKPEERLEEEPEWVKRAKDLSVQESPAISMPESELEQMASAPEQEPELEQPAAMDDTAAWLRSLDEEEKPSEPMAALDSQVEQPAAVEELQAVSEAQQPPADDEIDTWLKSLEGEEKPSEPAAADETAMWLKGLDEREAAPAETTESADVDLPAWMKDIDAEETPAEEQAAPMSEAGLESTWMPPAEETAPVPEPKAEEDALPSWLSELDKEEEQIATPMDEADLPAWLRAEETPAETPEPTLASDWKQAEETQDLLVPAVTEQAETLPLPSEPFDIPVEEPAAPEPAVVMEPPAPTPEPFQEPVAQRETGGLNIPLVDPMLGMARNELTANNIPGALDSYGKLIKKARYLDEVIYDLREALYRYPVDVNIWQSLGDAYMRANRLQDALDAYTKAEELLR